MERSAPRQHGGHSDREQHQQGNQHPHHAPPASSAAASSSRARHESAGRITPPSGERQAEAVRRVLASVGRAPLTSVRGDQVDQAAALTLPPAAVPPATLAALSGVPLIHTSTALRLLQRADLVPHAVAALAATPPSAAFRTTPCPHTSAAVLAVGATLTTAAAPLADAVASSPALAAYYASAAPPPPAPRPNLAVPTPLSARQIAEKYRPVTASAPSSAATTPTMARLRASRPPPTDPPAAQRPGSGGTDASASSYTPSDRALTPPPPVVAAPRKKRKRVSSDVDQPTAAMSPAKRPAKAAKSANSRTTLAETLDAALEDGAEIAPDTIGKLMDALANGSIQLEGDQARALAKMCLERVARVEDADFLAMVGQMLVERASRDRENSDDDNDETPRSLSTVHMFDRITVGLEASMVVVLVFHAHPDAASEEALLLIANTFKNHVKGSLVPVFDARERLHDGATERAPNVSNGRLTSLPVQVLTDTPHFDKRFQKLLYLLCTLMTRLRDLVVAHPRHAASDAVAIALAYGSLAPLFTQGAADNVLQMRGLELLCAIAARKPGLRTGIVDELVSNLIKSTDASGPTKKLPRRYKLPSGKAIMTVSALLMHLVQACVPEPPTAAGSITARAVVPDDDTHAPVMDQCRAMAAHMVKYLLARATKKSKAAATTEAEYVHLLRGIFDDVLTVLPAPEFPSAELFARVTMQLMLGVMEDEGIADAAVKALAMDVFSSLLCRTRQSHAKYADVVIGDEEIAQAQAATYAYLAAGAKTDVGLAAAQWYLVTEWRVMAAAGAATAAAADKKGTGVAMLDDSDSEDEHDGAPKPPVTDTTPLVWESRPLPENVDRAECTECMELLLAKCALLLRHTEPLLARVLRWFEAKEVAVRSRAVKVLTQVVQVDASLMNLAAVQAALAARLHDPSPSVRDSVLETVGKWMLSAPAQGTAGAAYFEVLLERVHDTALSVRKRAIRTLGHLAPRIGVDERIELATRVFGRLRDDEDTVSELAKKVLLDVVMPYLSVLAAAAASSAAGTTATTSAPVAGPITDQAAGNLRAHEAVSTYRTFPDPLRMELQAQALVFAGLAKWIPAAAVAEFLGQLSDDDLKGRPLALLVVALFHQVQTSGVAVDQATTATATEPFMNALRALGVVARARPDLITGDMLAQAAKYLAMPPTTTPAAPAQTEVHLVQHLALALFRDALDGDGGRIEIAISAHTLQDVEIAVCRILQWGAHINVRDSVAVLCMVARRIKSASGGGSAAGPDRVAKLLATSVTQLAVCRTSLQGSDPPRLPPKMREDHVRRLAVILGSMAQYGALPAPPAEGSPETVFALLHFFCLAECRLAEATRAVALQAIGYMVLQYSKLFLQPPMLRLIKGALDEKDKAPKLAEVVMEMLVQFMAKDDARAAQKLKSNGETFDRQAFLGTTMDFATAGISESLAQSLVTEITACALVPPRDPYLRLAELAQDVIGYIASNRLAHPKFVMPAIVALSASPHAPLASRARAHHLKLHAQHQSVIYDANRDALLAAYKYQAACQRTDTPVGFLPATDAEPVPMAMLHAFYAVVQSAKRDRRAVLLLLTRIFDMSPKTFAAARRAQKAGGAAAATVPELGHPACTQTVGLAQWVADNLATLPYKHEDEVLSVIQAINQVVAGIGLTIKHDLERHVGGNDDEQGEYETDWDTPTLARAALCMGVVLATKAHLVRAYRLSAAKVRNFQGGAESGGGGGAGRTAAAAAARTAARTVVKRDEHVAAQYVSALPADVVRLLSADEIDEVAHVQLASTALVFLNARIDGDPGITQPEAVPDDDEEEEEAMDVDVDVSSDQPTSDAPRAAQVDVPPVIEAMLNPGKPARVAPARRGGAAKGSRGGAREGAAAAGGAPKTKRVAKARAKRVVELETSESDSDSEPVRAAPRKMPAGTSKGARVRKSGG
ncbi:Sister chromatid cohesion protein 2 [Allomyces arbusculus]|nr:Sister chromatid cohesion protein 2 [Allomyces arbusculus]